MMITIQDTQFDPTDISQLYYAAVVTKDEGDEPMQVSLTWLDQHGKGKVEVLGYGIFVHILNDPEPYEFMYETREELDSVAAIVVQQIKQRRDGK